MERFDFIAKQCNWTTEAKVVIWKLIALQNIEVGGSAEEKTLLFLGNLGRIQKAGIKR